MPINFRTYNAEPRYGEDYNRLRSFLLELDDINYPFGRWDWMISHSYLNAEGLSKIGIWLDNEAIVGIATYDTMLDGKCFFPLKIGYENLLPEMIEYAEKNLTQDGKLKLLIRDGDVAFQKTAGGMGYTPTQSKDCDAVFDIDIDKIQYSLPEGFFVTSMKNTYDLFQYGQVLWKGFNHELNGEGIYAPTYEKIEVFRKEFERPNVNLEIKIAVVAPDGNFVSYCGMWQDDASQNALVEPVATDPAYRRIGLGRAAVLEAIRRCGILGAKKAYVGSSQQFYYNIGFRPCSTSTFWERKNVSNT
jgi:N-acetylglutamate synthase-like GNAT family acetyltransferase